MISSSLFFLSVPCVINKLRIFSYDLIKKILILAKRELLHNIMIVTVKIFKLQVPETIKMNLNLLEVAFCALPALVFSTSHIIETKCEINKFLFRCLYLLLSFPCIHFTSFSFESKIKKKNFGPKKNTQQNVTKLF